jgi:PleD family two-component response regulator
MGADDALHQADDALYMAKNRGRNCVHAAEGIL